MQHPPECAAVYQGIGSWYNRAGIMAAYPPIPRIRLPVMFQSWCRLTFLHWRYPTEALQRLIPAPLQVDTFGGAAWVGVTPFLLSGLRPPLLPPLPWISEFPETNCRTYVKAPDGSKGIWFFSLDAARAAAVVGARLAFGLPYAWSKMRVEWSGSQIRYESDRTVPGPSAMTRIAVECGARIEADDLTVFLTARFRLYSFIAGLLTYTDVEHAPWPLQAARAASAEQTLTRAAGLPQPEGAPLVHFSPGVRVRIAAPAILKWGRPS
jgi:uncharacterized protein